MVSGVVALMLEANPALGWRDVQEILLRSANILKVMLAVGQPIKPVLLSTQIMDLVALTARMRWPWHVNIRKIRV